jgi:tetratricopeptide (TPR) repeat protein
VDISWYKNHIQANSVFAWNYQDDFFAGYDHGKQAGTMSVADHNVVPGKKFWTWGNGPNGRAWDKILTDDDGPYIELMVGAYSDNQPDYSWLQPYETRSFAMNWYPFRDIGGVKKANLDAAVNLDVENGTAKIGFYTTSAHSTARVLLKAGEQMLLRETTSINPGKPWTKRIPVPSGIEPHDLVASIWDGGKELVSYQPVRLTPKETPPVVKPPAAPRDIQTNEELYLTGLRAQQFHDPNVDPMPYWEEALRRDAGDSRVNTALGITCFRSARYTEAEQYLRTALRRLTDRYTTPKEAEAVYYLGEVLKAQGKTDEAFTDFFKATWSQEWKSPAYYSLAEIAASRGDMAAALDFVDRSIDSNALNIRAQNLKAAVLRHLGRPEEALRVVSIASHRADPLDTRSMAEVWLASKDAVAAKTMASAMNAHPATAQKTAAEYFDAGLWQDGFDVLRQVTSAAPDQAKIHPMAYYYLGYFATKLGQPQKASEYYALARTMPPDYVFPFQSEEIEVLRQAVRANPRDGAPYYLGNLLYDWLPEEAAAMWQASERLDPSFAIVHRNLAIAYMHQKPGADLTKAIAELEKAVSLDRKYPLHFTELDDLYEQAGTPLEKRLPLFQENAATVALRDDAENRAIALEVALGRYDEAIRKMTGRPFAVAEGANLNVAEHWIDAHVLQAQQSIAAKRFRESLADLKAAVTIPANLPLGLGDRPGGREAEVAYWTGVADEGLGDHEKALAAWNQAARETGPVRGGGPSMSGGVQAYYRGLALQKLGQRDRARTAFQGLVQTGQNALQQAPAADTRGGRMRHASSSRVQTAQAHYLIGLGYLGLNETSQAKAELSQAVSLSPDLVGARNVLASLK